MSAMLPHALQLITRIENARANGNMKMMCRTELALVRFMFTKMHLIPREEFSRLISLLERELYWLNKGQYRSIQGTHELEPWIIILSVSAQC